MAHDFVAHRRAMEAGSTLLTEQQRASFQANGFLVVDVIPPAELPAMRRAFERLVDKQRGLWEAEVAASGFDFGSVLPMVGGAVVVLPLGYFAAAVFVY